MHGVVIVQLQDFVETNFGDEAWRSLLATTGDGGRVYEPMRVYDDGEVVRIVDAACVALGKSREQVLFAFGQFIAPKLIEMFWSLVDPSWRTLDVLEHTENAIHRVVRLNHEGADPPALASRRVAPNTVEISYSSRRKMCSLARGIIQGVAEHFGEIVEVREDQCMLQGAQACTLRASVGQASPL